MEHYKVLVVDDNLINRKMVAAFLSGYGFELSEAESGLKAIELVKENRFDLIFMDYRMPGMDGMEAADIIRRECGENGRTPVMVALTADAGEAARESFLNRGFQDFATKPLERKQLWDILKKWLGGLEDASESGDEKEQGWAVSIGREELLQEVRSALDSMERFRSRECGQKVEKLLTRSLEAEIRRRLEAVKELLGQFEDDEAEQLLRDLADELK